MVECDFRGLVAFGGNGEPVTGESVNTAIDDDGTHTVRLTVTNDAGETATTSTDVTVESADVPQSDDDDDALDDDGIPGFGIGAGALALLAVGFALVRRQ